MAISKIPIFEMRSAMRKDLNAVGLSGTTIESYLCSLNQLVRFMEEQSLEEYSANVGKSFLSDEKQFFAKHICKSRSTQVS